MGEVIELRPSVRPFVRVAVVAGVLAAVGSALVGTLSPPEWARAEGGFLWILVGSVGIGFLPPALLGIHYVFARRAFWRVVADGVEVGFGDRVMQLVPWAEIADVRVLRAGAQLVVRGRPRPIQLTWLDPRDAEPLLAAWRARDGG